MVTKNGAAALGEIFLAAVILTIFVLIVNFYVAVGAPGATGVHAKLEGVSFSKVCDVDLVNLLRAKTSTGLTFAELIAITKENPTQTKTLEDETEKFIDKNYRRISEQKAPWRIDIGSGDFIASVGPMEGLPRGGACTKIIPSFKAESPILVSLSLTE